MSGNRQWGILAAILVLAAVLRLAALGHVPLWCDEAYTALTVRLSLGEMLTTLFRTDDAPPLFYLLVKPTTALLGDSEAGVRAVSATAGMLTVLALLWWARRRDPARGGWAAAFMAVAAIGVFHAHQARSYALLLLLATGLVLAVKETLFGRSRAGPYLAIAAVLLCLTHHVAVILVLTSLCLWPLGDPARRPRLRSWVWWHVPALATWAALWIGASAQLETHRVLNAWTARYWMDHPLALAPLHSLGVFVPGALPASTVPVGLPSPRSLAAFWSVLSAALGVLCLAAAARQAARSSRAKRACAQRQLAVEAALMILPLLGLLGASLVATPVYVLGRTDLLAYPAFVLLIGRGLAGMPKRAAGGVLTFWLVISLLSLAPTFGFAAPPWAKGADRDVARRMVAEGLSPDDWVVHTFMTAPSIEYYLDRLDAPHRTAWFPQIAARNTASPWPTPLDSLTAYRAEAAALRRAMEAEMTSGASAWIFGAIEPSAATAILQGRAPREVRVDQVGYPVSALVLALVGTQPISNAHVFQQDWVSGPHVLLRIPRSSWIPAESSATR